MDEKQKRCFRCTQRSTQQGYYALHEVEFDVTSSSDQLPLLLLLREFVILVLFNDRTVGLDYRVQGFLGKSKVLFRIFIILVIKKDAAESTSLMTVLNHKVTIGPGLELLVIVGVVIVADPFVRSMKMCHVLFVDITRSYVRPTAKPPNHQTTPSVSKYL